MTSIATNLPPLYFASITKWASGIRAGTIFMAQEIIRSDVNQSSKVDTVLASTLVVCVPG